MQTQMKKPPSQLAAMVRQASQNIERLAGGRVEHLGLTYRQMVVLVAVLGREGSSQREITDATGIDRTTVTNICRTLEKRDLLSQEKSPDDARSVRVTLTKEGKELATQGVSILRRIESELSRAVKPNRPVVDEVLLQFIELKDKAKNGEKA